MTESSVNSLHWLALTPVTCKKTIFLVFSCRLDYTHLFLFPPTLPLMFKILGILSAHVFVSKQNKVRCELMQAIHGLFCLYFF